MGACDGAIRPNHFPPANLPSVAGNEVGDLLLGCAPVLTSAVDPTGHDDLFANFTCVHLHRRQLDNRLPLARSPSTEKPMQKFEHARHRSQSERSISV